MMSRNATLERPPGVYFEDAPPPRAPLRAIRTDVAGFVGLGAWGPVQRAVRINSEAHFSAVFGPSIPQSYLADSVSLFFRNGGRVCYVVRVAGEGSSCARWHVPGADGRIAFTLEALSPGSWANRFTIRARRTSRDAFDLVIRREDRIEEYWPGLSTQPWLDAERTISNPEYFAEMLGTGRSEYEGEDDAGADGDQEEDTRSGSRLVRVLEYGAIGDDWNVADILLTQASVNGCGSLGRLTERDFSDPADLSGGKGIDLLERVDAVSIVTAPDIVWESGPPPAPLVMRCSVLPADEDQPEAPAPVVASEKRAPFDEEAMARLQQRLVQHSARLRDRMAILDVPGSHATPEQALSWRRRFSSKFSALYYSWIVVDDTAREHGAVRRVPASGAVAGVYARMSLTTGVHAPPANQVLDGAVDTSWPITPEQHGRLNANDVNVIRVAERGGVFVAGDRTLAGSSEQEWRYVNVRRLVSMIEEAIDEQLQWVVFEPHNAVLRRDVDRAVRSLLDRMWTRGMLDGSTAEEAYSVTCDDSTNPESEMERRRLICRVGVQPPLPAEFVEVRLAITESGVETLE